MVRICFVLLRVALVLAMKIAVEAIVRAWLAIRPIRRWRTRRAMKSWRAEHPDEILENFHEEPKEVPMLNGKLTYAAQAGMAIVFAGQLLGVEITQEAAASIVGIVLALVGVFGRWRATKAE